MIRGAANYGRLIPTLQDGYANFWNSIRIHANGYVQPVSKNDFKVQIRNGRLRIETRTPIWLIGLPVRRKEVTGEIFDVAITFEQDVDVKGLGTPSQYFEAVASYVRILYLDNDKIVSKRKVEDSTYRGHVRSGFHFDLVNQENKNRDWYDHPIYHANFDLKCIDLNTLGRNDYELPQVSGRIDFPRIPTAPMDLAGVIFLLLRDHRPDLVETGWPDNIRKLAKRLPRYPHGVLNQYIKQGQILDCLSWYNTDGGRSSVA